MTVQELISLLKTYPPDAEVHYRDMNFGGKNEPIGTHNFELDQKTNCVLVDSVWFEGAD